MNKDVLIEMACHDDNISLDSLTIQLDNLLHKHPPQYSKMLLTENTPSPEPM